MFHLIQMKHSGKKCHIFVHFEKGQFSDKNVICVEMSIRIAKIPKIPRVSIYMATFELKLVESLWFLLSISIQQNQLVSWKIWTKIGTFFPLCIPWIKKNIVLPSMYVELVEHLRMINVIFTACKVTIFEIFRQMKHPKFWDTTASKCKQPWSERDSWC